MITIRRIAGTAMPAATPVTKRPASSGPTDVDAAITSRPTTLSTVPTMTSVPGVAAVGERGDRHLGDEAGDEADADDRAERRLADAVLVAHVVEQREQGAVAGGEERADEPQHDE